jgi:integrase
MSMAVRLTDRLIAKLAPPAAGSVIVWDSEVRGLGLRTTAAGVKSFVLNYRNATGVERRLTIGRFGDWSVAAARDEAKALKRRIDRGEDPLRAEKELREAPDVAALAERYLAEWGPKKSTDGQERDRRMIAVDVLPVIGRLKVADVTRDDIDRIHRRITGRGSPIRANRTMSLLSKMFALAETQWGWRPVNAGNPCRGLARNPEIKRERFLSGEEIKRLVEALRVYPTTVSRQHAADARIASAAVLFLLLTGARFGEAMKAEWREIDLAGGTWSKPSHHVKTRRTVTIPLSAAARALLASIRPKHVGDGDRIFPVHALQVRRTCWRAVTTATGIENFRLHDLRHSHASLLVASGLSLPIVGRLLGHTEPATTQRYAHLAVDSLRAAVETVGSVVMPAVAAEVIPLALPKRTR